MEVLNRSISLHGEKTLLIIDEYHMLSDAQKDKLFGWMEDRLRGYVGEQAKRFFKIELSKLSRYEPINGCKRHEFTDFFSCPLATTPGRRSRRHCKLFWWPIALTPGTKSG